MAQDAYGSDALLGAPAADRIRSVHSVEAVSRPLGSSERLLSVCTRLAGFQWINVQGKPAGRKQAPIIVSNHRSVNSASHFFLALFLLFPSSQLTFCL
jgi:hypothetical protein